MHIYIYIHIYIHIYIYIYRLINYVHSRSFLWWLIYTIPILAEAFIFMIFSPQIPGKNIPSQLALCLFFCRSLLIDVSFLALLPFSLRQQLLFFVDDKKSRVEIHEAKNSTFFHPTTTLPTIPADDFGFGQRDRACGGFLRFGFSSLELACR